MNHPSRRRRFTISIALAMALALIAPIAALAHPLGNFTINRYSRLELGADQIRVRYVIDMAEIPTFQEKAKIDVNHDDTIGDAEKAQYLKDQVAALQSNLHLIINDESIALEPQETQLDFLPGQGGLQTMRIAIWFAAKMSLSKAAQADYRDDNFTGRLGWQEIVVQPASGVDLLESSVSTKDLSNELRSYPQDLLQSPPAVSSATFRFAPAGISQAHGPALIQLAYAQSSQSLQGRTTDRFAELITIPDLGFGAIALALVVAFVWGALHAFSPGHGKTIVAAYLVGSRATTRHALFLGLTTTITHTAGVFTLGLITLLASQYVVPDQVYPWLEAMSGALVMVIGVSLFIMRLRKARGHDHVDHDHVDHDHGLHLHDHVHDHDHDHSHDHQHDHQHEHHTHSHLPPGADGSRVTWRSLLALGISGGLLPCPSALVVMLGAIALNRVAFGLVLIVVFSAGLAGTLIAIGILMVRAKGLIERLNRGGRLLGRIPINPRVIQVLPAVSALFILIAGLGITVTALAQAGVIRV